MTDVKVIIPWLRHPSRRAGINWVKAWYASQLGPEAVQVAQTHRQPFNKCRVINEAVRNCDAEIVIIADADCVVTNRSLRLGIERARQRNQLILPHNSTCLTNQEQANWLLSQPPEQGASGKWFRSRRGVRSPGGIWILPRSLFLSHQMDERFVRWGSEDVEFIRRVGHYRIKCPLFHIRHKPASRKHRRKNRLRLSPIHAIATTLYTVRDPQRKQTYNPVGVVDTLAGSIWPVKYSPPLYVFHNALPTDEASRLVANFPVRLKQVEPQHRNPYFARWLAYKKWLESPDGAWCQWLWMVDASDVRAIRRTWDNLDPSKLYIGHEKSSGFKWLYKHHKIDRVTENEIPLLNAGVVGGHRSIVLAFLTEIEKTIDQRGRDLTDMGAVNEIARQFPLSFGPELVTDFKQYSDNGIARWQHK